MLGATSAVGYKNRRPVDQSAKTAEQRKKTLKKLHQKIEVMEAETRA
jgi:hypothetical protein